MTGSLDAAVVRRRFLILTATRWFPTGLLIPVFVVLLLQRGLSLVEVGVLSGVQSVAVLLLELPTGGLADTIGRRRVLLLASAFDLATLALLATASSFGMLALAYGLQGVYRALETGPLQSWYVDAAQIADPDADIERGLSASGLLLGVSIALGAVVGGALALAPQPARLPALALPVVVSFGVRLADAVALAVLLREPPRAARAADAVDGRSPVSALAAGLYSTGITVRDAVRVIRRSRALLGLVAVELLWGAGMTAVELFSAPRAVDLLDDAEQGVAAFAVASAVAWTVSGLGSAAAPWLARRTGSWAAAAVVTRVAQGLGVGVAAVVAGLPGLLIGYLAFYLVHGAANAAHYGLVHRQSTAANRATVVSANSLASRLGGTVAAPALGALAVVAGIPAVFAVAALVLAAPAPLYLLCRAAPDRTRPEELLWPSPQSG